MSRRCRGWKRQFRPGFGAQRPCWDCVRRISDDTTTKEETMSTTIDQLEYDLAASRRILARVALLLRQGRVEAALDEIPITEEERSDDDV